MKKIVALVSLIILILAIPVGVYLVQRQQSLKSKASAAGTGTNTSYNMGVLVLKYFPLTADRQNIDISVTGDVGGSYSSVKQLTIDATNALKTGLEKASTYLGYRDSAATPSLTYQIVDTKEYTQPVPIKARTDRPTYPDYNKIMQDHNICNYVDNQGVREVWIWAYQGKNRPGFPVGTPYLGIDEAKMSGPNGDISNSSRYNDMPICRNTYRVYTFNYNGGAGGAMHSWGHQLESELDAVDSHFFRSKFQGPSHPGCNPASPPDIDGNGVINSVDSAQCTATKGDGIGRCGSVHNPPNSTHDYDIKNPTPNRSDCMDWNPNSMGQLSNISCQNWGCSEGDINNNFETKYYVWLWQNLPGKNNTKTYQGRPLRNWWDVHGDFDNVMRTSKTLLSSGSITPTAPPATTRPATAPTNPPATTRPTQPPATSPPSTSTTGSGIYIKVANTAQELPQAQERLFEANPGANWTIPPQKLFQSNSSIIDWNSLPANTPKTVYVQFKINNVWSSTQTYTFLKRN